MNFIEIAARKKLGAEAGWRAFEFEAVRKGKIRVTGSVPIGVYTTGKMKGHPIWGKRKDAQKVVITGAEVDAAQANYERETGLCWKCEGSGQEWVGWSRDAGDKHQPCRCCSATGKAAKS